MALTDLVPRDVLTLAELLQAEWPAARERIRLSGHPTCEGDDADAAADTAGAAKAAAEAAAAAAKDDDADADDDADDAAKAADDVAHWKKMARQNERNLKKERADREAIAAKLKEREAADLSEQEKAIAKAREDATSEVTTKYEATIRADRIESSVTKLALKGLKGKDAGGNDITLKFADPDDAQLRLDRAIRTGDVAYDDLYADGKVNTAAVTEFLTDLLEEHPRLRAEESNGGGKQREVVDMDGGKGKGSGGGKSLAEMTPDEHLKAIQGSR
jgi:hypothetical protein